MVVENAARVSNRPTAILSKWTISDVHAAVTFLVKDNIHDNVKSYLVFDRKAPSGRQPDCV